MAESIVCEKGIVAFISLDIFGALLQVSELSTFPTVYLEVCSFEYVVGTQIDHSHIFYRTAIKMGESLSNLNVPSYKLPNRRLPNLQQTCYSEALIYDIEGEAQKK